MKPPFTLTLLLLVFLCTGVRAQKSGRELLYVHTDRTLYAPGNGIWLKAYLTDGLRRTAPVLTDVVRLQLLDGNGSVVDSAVVHRGKYGHDGYLQLKSSLPGGRYTLRAYTNWLGNYGSASFYTKYLYVQQTYRPDLLLQLETQREAYGPDDRLNYTLTARDRFGKALRKATVVADLRVAGRAVSTRTLTTNSRGEAFLDLRLPQDLATPDVILAARVSADGATETVLRPVSIVLDSVRLDFFPEGGYRAAGAPQRIAFRAVGPNGKPVDVAGDILAGNRRITTFSATHNGYGHFDLPANAPAKLTAGILRPTKIVRPVSLPEPNNTALAARLSVSGRELELTLHGQVSGLRFRLATEDSLFLEQKADENLKLKLTDYPAGVYRATLTDARDNARWERLIFLEPDLQPVFSEVLAPKLNFPELRFFLKDRKGQPLRGNFSLAVVDDARYTRQNDQQPHIVAQLLLQSQLRGKIFEPNDYFDTEQPAARRALDDVVLCHGWRGLDWELAQRPRYEHEQTGVYGKYTNAGLFPSRPRYYGSGHRHPFTLVEKTPLKGLGNGRFRLRLPRPEAGYSLMIGNKSYGHNNRLLLPLEHRYKPYLGEKRTGMAAPALTQQREVDVDITAGPQAETTSSRISVAAKHMTNMDARLEEVVITGYAINSRGYLSESTGRVVYRISAQQDYTISDGYRSDLFRAKSFSFTGGALNPQVKRSFPPVRHYGDGYRPRGTRQRPDPLFWTAEVNPDATGRVKLRCQPSATTTTFRIILEGIAGDGTPVHAETTFATRAETEISARLPTSAAVGDTLMLTATLRNNTDTEMLVYEELVPGGKSVTRLERRERPVNLPARGNVTVLRHLVVARAGGPAKLKWVMRDARREILFSEEAQLTLIERTHREAVLAEAANRQSFAAEFTVAQRSGPLTGELVLHGGTIDGIMAERAKMIREPHGCFEQVSSTSYPNALAVRMLEEAPWEQYDNTLAQARQYLDSGYRQLARYEMPGGGFSLFGRSKARVDLTAYGLQQFADLREVYDGIDPAMIRRARQFLRGRFDQTPFAAQPDRVYVLLALLRHGDEGMGAELERHKQMAMTSRRPLYRSLVAHALLAAGDTLGARTQVQGMLPEMLGEILPAEKSSLSLSHSRGTGQALETRGWYLRAYVATQGYDRHAAGLLNRLMETKNKSRYFSTQAMVQYLAGVAAVARYQKPVNPAKVTLRLNGRILASADYETGQSLRVPLDMTAAALAGDNRLEVSFAGPGPWPLATWRGEWARSLPVPTPDAPLALLIEPSTTEAATNEAVRWAVRLENLDSAEVYAPLVRIGLPANLALLAKDLDPLMEGGTIDYYEIDGAYLNLYFKRLAAGERRNIPLDLTVMLGGSCQPPSSVAYPYYEPERRWWLAGPVLNASPEIPD